MRFFAILKDSLRETIDSKVFFVILIISEFPVFVMATLSLEPNPPDEGLRKISQRFFDGSEVDVPLLGTIKALQPFVRYSIEEIRAPENSNRPWEAEYQFTIEARDLMPHGSRLAVLRYL